MTIQSIIVYRNPLEAAMWESGALGYVAFASVVFFIVFLILDLLFKLVKKNIVNRWLHKNSEIITNINLAISAFVALFTIWYTV